MAEVTIKIEGMSCQHCVMHVKKAVDGVDGVNSADISIGLAKVEFDEAKTGKEAVAEAINNAGYKIVV
jgi:copper chaperone